MIDSGIIRRIDDLGRVVIPKEIRSNLGIKEGDELEIWVDGDRVCYRKHEIRLTPAQKYVLDAWNVEHPEMQMTPAQFLGRE